MIVSLIGVKEYLVFIFILLMTSDVNQVQTGINLMLRLLLRSPIVVVGASIMALFVNVYAGLIFLGVTILLSIVVFLVMKITIPLYVKVQGKLDKILKRSRENCQRLQRTIKIIILEILEKRLKKLTW